jgi:hypothetical protein
MVAIVKYDQQISTLMLLMITGELSDVFLFWKVSDNNEGE